MSVDPKIIYEIWAMFPPGGGYKLGRTFDLVVGLLRGRQSYSLCDPVWSTWDMEGSGVLTLGPVVCRAKGRLNAAVVLVAHVLGEACPIPLAALASRILAEGWAQPVEHAC